MDTGFDSKLKAYMKVISCVGTWLASVVTINDLSIHCHALLMLVGTLLASVVTINDFP